jgi:hypothetical protein
MPPLSSWYGILPYECTGSGCRGQSTAQPAPCRRDPVGGGGRPEHPVLPPLLGAPRNRAPHGAADGDTAPACRLHLRAVQRAAGSADRVSLRGEPAAVEPLGLLSTGSPPARSPIGATCPAAARTRTPRPSSNRHAGPAGTMDESFAGHDLPRPRPGQCGRVAVPRRRRGFAGPSRAVQGPRPVIHSAGVGSLRERNAWNACPPPFQVVEADRVRSRRRCGSSTDDGEDPCGGSPV